MEWVFRKRCCSRDSFKPIGVSIFFSGYFRKESLSTCVNSVTALTVKAQNHYLYRTLNRGLNVGKVLFLTKSRFTNWCLLFWWKKEEVDKTIFPSLPAWDRVNVTKVGTPLGVIRNYQLLCLQSYNVREEKRLKNTSLRRC